MSTRHPARSPPPFSKNALISFARWGVRWASSTTSQPEKLRSLATLRGRLLGKVEVRGACWLWCAATMVNGYAVMGIERRTFLAHRVSYLLFKGDLGPEQVDHLCRNRSCVNPAHLERVSQQENIRRGNGGAHNRVKTKCPQGHPYTPDNTYTYTVRGSPHRQCKICSKKRSKASYWRTR